MTASLLFALTLPLLPLAAFNEEAAAHAAFNEVRVQFTHRAPSVSIEALSQIAARWPDTDAAVQASLWQGDLLLREHRDDAADQAYRNAERGARDPWTRALALRGLGTTALDRHAWSEAETRLQLAAQVATPPLSAEIDEKLRLARREQTRFLLEVIAWAVIVLVTFGLALRLTRRGGIAVPTATKVLAPIYTLILAIVWARDTGVAHALVYLSIGSIALVTLAFAPARPLSRRATLLVAIAITLANMALLFIALRRAGILDILWETLRVGGDFG